MKSLTWPEFLSIHRMFKKGLNKLQLEALQRACTHFNLSITVDEVEDAIEHTKELWPLVMGKTHAATTFNPATHKNREEWWEREGCPQAGQILAEEFDK